MDPVTFEGDRLRLICTSDTHNEDPTSSVPSGDILIHAGDMTDNGTFEELKNAFDWLVALPHKVKIVVAGNHDMSLDPHHPSFSEKAVELFKSPEAFEANIHYLDRETRTVAYLQPFQWRTEFTSNMKEKSKLSRLPIRIYGNSMTPDFLQSSYAFTYMPAPSKSATDAWSSAPGTYANTGLVGRDTSSKELNEDDKLEQEEYAPIYVTHGPPLHHLDWIEIPGLSGCAVQAAIIKRNRPLLCVFGHYHISRGVETVLWNQEAVSTDYNAEEHMQETLVPLMEKANGNSQFADSPKEQKIVDLPWEIGKSTTFVNAAWIPDTKRVLSSRNPPIIIDLLVQ